MGKIFGQKIPLRTLFNAHKRGALPQTLLIHGPKTVGKLESALNFAKSLYCSNKKLGFCDACTSCTHIQFYRHPHLIAFVNDDRLPNIKCYLHILTQALTSKPELVKYQLLGELSNLIRRVNDGFLSPLRAEKKSYPAGVKLTDKQWETQVSLGYRLLAELESASLPLAKNYDVDTLIQTFEKIQNGLDRTLISKQGLDIFFKLSRSAFHHPKVFILQNIQLINHQIVGGLLKILEEPPPNLMFILISDNISALQANVITPLRSRSFEVPFRALSLSSQKDIFEKKMGLDAKGLKNVPLTQNMENFIRSQKEDNAGTIMLDIFINNCYNTTRLFKTRTGKSINPKRAGGHLQRVFASHAPGAKGLS